MSMGCVPWYFHNVYAQVNKSDAFVKRDASIFLEEMRNANVCVKCTVDKLHEKIDIISGKEEYVE